jgi:cytochrome c oxidase subunit II
MLARRVWCCAAGLLLLCSCAPEPVTTEGRAAQGLYVLFSWLAAGVFIVVAGLIGWSIIRFRARGDDDTFPEQFHTNLKLEILWFAIPQAIVIGLFIASAFVLSDVDDTQAATDVTVQVEAFQWGWRFTYEDDVIVESLPSDPGVIVLPVQRRITFELTSRDVIHSFYVPEFFVKRDVVPGRTNTLAVTIDEVGTYTARCAEFCGLLHDRMDLTVKAVDGDEFDDWLAAQEEA